MERYAPKAPFMQILFLISSGEFDSDYCRFSCLIDDETSFLLLGGWQEEYQHEAHRRVTRYDIKGFLEDLPRLTRDRYNSGCSSYTADNNKKVRKYFKSY